MFYWSRRAFTVAASLSLAACATSQQPSALAPPPAAPTAATVAAPAASQAAPEVGHLAQHFAAHFSLGVAIEPGYLGELGPLIVSNFNRLTAENTMKFARIHPKEDEYNTAPADALADFARQHRMTMTGHALVWHQETPDWLLQGKAADVSARLKKHIDTVVARYADVTDNWDVVNEGVSDSGDKLYRDAGEGAKLFGVLGDKLIPTAFSYAEAAVKASGKNIELYYNDYNMSQPAKRAKAIRIAESLKVKGIRIDGIGAQAHWNMTSPTVQEVQTMIDEIVAAGLKVKISELDISIYPKDDWSTSVWEPERPFTPELAAQQAARYKELFAVFVKNAEHITSVTLWGVSDDRTWLDNFPSKGRNNHPLLFDDGDQPKPAYWSLLEL